MGGWAPSHDASGPVRALCERIVVAQRDEIAFMQRWLRERHEPVPDADPRGQVMPGMDHPMLMPGMLTPAQMAQLDSARGSGFDRLFLTFMIMHHQGAITMVNQLLATPGAAQDGTVFRFAADVNADQTTEIDRMTRMLDALKGELSVNQKSFVCLVSARCRSRLARHRSSIPRRPRPAPTRGLGSTRDG